MPEVINIDFTHIWHFEAKSTGWVGLELNVILTQTVGRFDMWVTHYTSILTLAKLKYFMSKDLVLRHYKLVLLLITQGEIQSIEQEILSAKVKPDPKTLQNYTKLWLKDEFLMTLMKQRLGFHCWTVLTFWNLSGGYVTQFFNSQTLRGDV